MNKLKYIILSLCLLLTGCQPGDNKLSLNFDSTKTIAVCSSEDKIISLSEEESVVNNIINQFKSYKFTKTDKILGDSLYSFAWYPSSLQFESFYNLKFRYNNEFFLSAYDELFNNSSIESLSVIDNQTIIYKNNYYKSNKDIDYKLLEDVLTLADNYVIKIFVPNENFDTLSEKEVIVKDVEEQTVLKELTKEGILPDFIKVNSVKIDESAVHIDFNQDFRGFLMTMGSAGETLIIKSITNSYLKTYGMDQVVITCDNEHIETGHNIYDEPLTYMP